MNIIIIDCDIDSDGSIAATHQIDLSSPGASMIIHPTAANQTMTPLQYVAWLQANKSKHTQTGWDVTTKLQGFPAGHTRWQVLVDACAQPTATPDMLALKLTY